jgi:deoxyhypusine synthase
MGEGHCGCARAHALAAMLNEACGCLKVIARLGKEINNPESVCYWAWRNGIPIFCPGLTDGSLGDMIFFHTYKNPGLIIDIVADIRLMNDQAMKAAPQKTGVIILGGGALSIQEEGIANANASGSLLASWADGGWVQGQVGRG